MPKATLFLLVSITVHIYAGRVTCIDMLRSVDGYCKAVIDTMLNT